MEADPPGIVVFECETADHAFQELHTLARNQNVAFGGHRCASWRLQSTLRRHAPSTDPDLWDIDGMLNHFWVRLRSVGEKLPFPRSDRRAMLEYARHYGLPSPLIDFSQSPYVALFFALNGVRPQNAE